MVRQTRTGRAGGGGAGIRRVQARVVFTLLGIAALLVGAVLNWETGLAGNKLTLRSLIQNDFTTRGDVLRTVAAACVLVAAVALLSLLDRTGWLTRLAGLAAVVLFAMFAVQVFRQHGENVGASYHALRPGAWCELGAGVLLLLGGLIRYRRRNTRPETATEAVIEQDATEQAVNEPDVAAQAATEPTTTGQAATTHEDEQDEERAGKYDEYDEQPVLTAEKP